MRMMKKTPVSIFCLFFFGGGGGNLLRDLEKIFYSANKTGELGFFFFIFSILAKWRGGGEGISFYIGAVPML